MKPITICVTGGTGFIGQHFARRLERENGVQIKVLTRLLRSEKLLSQNILYVQGDLLEYESLLNFVDKESVVVHLAYLSRQSRQENLEALGNLSRACCEKGISRFVHVSTAVVSGNTADSIVTESTECQPVSDYEVTKLELESFVIQQLGHSCDVTILRPTCVFGVGGKNLVKLVDDMVSDSLIVNYLKRSLFHRRRLNLVGVENVAEALWFLSSFEKHDLRGERFIVSEDNVPENNYDDISDYLAKELAITPPPWPRLPLMSSLLPAALKLRGRSNGNPGVVYSCEKLVRLGYQKAIGFHEGLKRFLDWYKLEMNKASE